MYILISKKQAVGCNLWLWSTDHDANAYWGPSHLPFDLKEGYSFVKGRSNSFDNPNSPDYDPIRCGVFADWLQDNEDRLLAQVEEAERPLAAERLSQLRDWLRSGFQKST